jgi:hypothetical protein
MPVVAFPALTTRRPQASEHSALATEIAQLHRMIVDLGALEPSAVFAISLITFRVWEGAQRRRTAERLRANAHRRRRATRRRKGGA